MAVKHMILNEVPTTKILIIDVENEYNYLCKKLNGKVNPIYKVLYLKSLLEIFLKEHQGKYDIDNLQDWMNLFWFIISSSDDIADKIGEFINLSLITHRKMKYRDIMRKSHF